MRQNIHEAAKRGDVESVLARIGLGTPVDIKDDDGWTPLMFAATHGRVEVVKALLAHKADTEVLCDAHPPLFYSCFRRPPPDYRNCTALVMAATCGNVKTIHLLLKAGANLQARSMDGKTALVRAAGEGHTRTVGVLLSWGAGKDQQDAEEALRLAALFGHLSIVRMLLDSGVEVDARDTEGQTALMNAAVNRETAVLQTLLDAGADVNAAGRYGESALSQMLTYGTSNEMIDLLRRSGARLILFDAIKLNDVEAARALIDEGANVDAREKSGHTPLTFAAIRDSVEMVRLLIEKGANVKAKVHYTDKSAYEWASDDAVRELLKQAAQGE